MELCMSAYCIAASGDKRDRSQEIQQQLQRDGVCLLGSGEFYVSGVQMPDGTAIRGMGNATKVILLDDVQEGAAISMGSFCTVEDLYLTGASEDLGIPKELGKRHGIAFTGEATPQTKTIHPAAGIISGIVAMNFTGGGLYFRDTGYNDRCSTTVTNCHMLYCGAGIYIEHFSEYHKFTNVACHDCLYGCVNNGGNNMFVNCGFTSNTMAFLIDNSHGQSKNNSHGSAVGCTFNHSGKNEGIGVCVLGAPNGFIFSGGQMFYSKIVLENSDAIVFTGMNYSRDIDISIKGGSAVLLSDSMFSGAPKVNVEDNSSVKFVNCILRDGSEI